LRLIDSETMEAVEVEISPHTLNLYQKALNGFMNDFKESCSRLQIASLQVSSDISLDQLVFEKLQQAGMIR
ncbi:MAG: hypothetical protein GX783_12555, partial [Clostridiales bacterium]|nr:hypothetical protein [Clostridiales bacterium]